MKVSNTNIMAKLEYEITFDVKLLKKVIRQAEGQLFASIFDGDEELQSILNVNGISESDD